MISANYCVHTNVHTCNETHLPETEIANYIHLLCDPTDHDNLPWWLPTYSGNNSFPLAQLPCIFTTKRTIYIYIISEAEAHTHFIHATKGKQHNTHILRIHSICSPALTCEQSELYIDTCSTLPDIVSLPICLFGLGWEASIGDGDPRWSFCCPWTMHIRTN